MPSVKARDDRERWWKQRRKGGTGSGKTTDVVAGTCLVNSVPARVLFDSGVNLSFVSMHFARLLHVTPRPLEGGFEVEVADDRKAWVGEVLEDCSIGIDGHCFPVGEV